MKFNELKAELKHIDFDTIRTDGDNYFETVIVKGELAKLTARLEKFFGLPVWPSENQLLPKAREAIKDFGGIKPGQNLYFWSEGNDVLFAMLWPWQDGWHTTVKIIHGVGKYKTLP